MRLERLRVYDFRLYHEAILKPAPGLNLLIGPNGAGKTTLLEAAHLLSAARSFRAKRESELVRWGQPGARVEGYLLTDQGRPRNLSLQWVKVDKEWHKTAFFQNDKVLRLADFLGCLPASLFTPGDRDLVTGSPVLRRRYLDLQLSKLYPLHLQELAQLKKVLSSRNALLRRQAGARELRPWDRMLFELTLKVGQRRQEATTTLQQLIDPLQQRLSEPKALDLKYRQSWPEEREAFAERLRELSERERSTGVTQLSPQKDDLDISLDGRPLRLYGSQGQQRSAALVLRLAEAEHLARERDETSVLLLDDALGELDPERQERLLDYLQNQGQVLLSSSGPVPLSGLSVTTHQIREGTL